MDDGTLGAENRGHQPQIGQRSESADDTGTVEKRGHPHLRARAFEKQVSPPGFLPDLSIEARLDRISEQVDACLEVLVKGRMPPAVPKIPSLNRQLSSLSGRGGVEPVSSSQSSRQNMIPFTVWDRAETREMTEEGPPANEDRENAALTEEEVPSRKHARPGKVRSLDLRLASQFMDPADYLQEELPIHRLLRRSPCDRVWELLEDPESSRAAYWISQLMKVIVIVSVIVANSQLSQEPLTYSVELAVWDMVFDIIFFIEFLCRIFSAPSKKEYMKDAFNWADVASATGLPLRVSIGLVMEEPAEPARATIQAILLFVLPTVRFLKLLRYFEAIRLLIDAFRKSLAALPVLMYTMALMVVLSSTALYLLEPRTNIPGIQHSLWLCVVTMTTVGYGDFVPKSVGGYIIASVLTIASVLFLAMPVGIIGHEFTVCWQGRDQVLSVTRAQKAMLKWGYAVEDVRSLLEYVDDDGDGRLDFSEILELFTEMRIGLRAETVTTLFTMCDSDQKGRVSYKEFLYNIFPMEGVKDTLGRVSKRRRESSRKVSSAFTKLDTSQSLSLSTINEKAVVPTAD